MLNPPNEWDWDYDNEFFVEYRLAYYYGYGDAKRKYKNRNPFTPNKRRRNFEDYMYFWYNKGYKDFYL